MPPLAPGHDSAALARRSRSAGPLGRPARLPPEHQPQECDRHEAATPHGPPGPRAILADPAVLLDDRDIMRVLVAANDRALGPNIVDMRGIAMDRLRQRLDRLEDTHRSVIAAAYDNIAGTAQVHRAVLRLLEPERFETFLRDLGGRGRGDPARRFAPPRDRGRRRGRRRRHRPARRRPRARAAGLRGRLPARPAAAAPPRAVALRPVGARLGPRRRHPVRGLPRGSTSARTSGCSRWASRDERHFLPQHGTDLLAFLGAAAERALRRFLG